MAHTNKTSLALLPQGHILSERRQSPVFARGKEKGGNPCRQGVYGLRCAVADGACLDQKQQGLRGRTSRA